MWIELRMNGDKVAFIHQKAIEHVRELAKQSQTKQNSDNKIIQGNAKLFDKSDCQNGPISQTMKQNFPQKNKPS